MIYWILAIKYQMSSKAEPRGKRIEFSKLRPETLKKLNVIP